MAPLNRPYAWARQFVMSWWGPAALAACALLWFHKTSGGGRDDFLWAGILVASGAAVLIVRRRLSWSEVMALEVLAATVVDDRLTWVHGGVLRDLHLYLNAGAQFMAHGTAYTTTALHGLPPGGVEYLPFLYAPPTLPIFGLLSELPRGVVDVLWVAASVGAVLISLRSFGLNWRWTVVALLWTPIAQGLFVGNVVIPSLILFGAAARAGGPLVLGPLLKPQNGVVSLWLLRERAWSSLRNGLLALVLVVGATLPFTGIDLWRQWFEGLAAYQQSQNYLPYLYGLGLGRYLPLVVFVAVAAVALAGALWASGREGLARLGLASVVASPSLYTHGFVFAIPAFLRLRSEWLWLAAGMACVTPVPWPQLALAMGVASWFIPWMARRPETEQAIGDNRRRPLHPLGAVIEPWPSASEVRGKAS
jgi:hypothetical protein